MIGLLIAYWPAWLFLALVVIGALALCRAAAAGDAAIDRARAAHEDELAARRDVRPAPAPIDVGPHR